METKNKSLENQPTLKKELKILSYNWITSTSAHAIPHVFRTSQIYLKVLWLVFFACSFAGCSYVVANSIMTYFDYNTNVKFGIVTDTPTYYPAITFCNLNPFFKKRASNYISKVLKDNNLSYLLNLSRINGDETATYLMNVAQTMIKANVATNLTTQQRQAIGWNISEMLLSCFFNGLVCGSLNFIYFYDYNYGNCYTFNSGYDSNGNSTDIRKVNSAGPESGLQLELFVGDDTNDANFVYTSGVIIVVSNQSITPLLESEGTHVSAGFETNIGIERTFTTKLPSPYSSCLSDNSSPDSYNSDLYKAIFNRLKHKTYVQKYCYRLCYQKTVIYECNCSDASLPNPFPGKDNVEISNCISNSQLSCVVKAKGLFQNRQIDRKCALDCPDECYSVKYSYDYSISSFPTSFYSNWIQLQQNVLDRFQNNKTTPGEIKLSVAKVKIFYSQLSATTITETADLTIETVLANIGGQLGLFLGMSLLSFVEIFVLCGEIIRVCFMYKKKNTVLNDTRRAIRVEVNKNNLDSKR